MFYSLRISTVLGVTERDAIAWRTGGDEDTNGLQTIERSPNTKLNITLNAEHSE